TKKLFKNLFTMLSLSEGFLIGFFTFLILCLLHSYLKGLLFVQRVQNLIGRRLDIFEQVQDSDEDEGIVDDEFLFSDLNPEQSVEKYRRKRLDAAAAALKDASNKVGN
ncbi:hypothetical protein KR038_001971, partial [Drosophila bunnanda]